MNLQENIQRIKSMMGIIKEETSIFPFTVSGSFKGDNGDRSHAFQSTGGVVVGGMQTEVNKTLKEAYAAGYNPSITKVTVTIDLTTKTTSWEVTIDESTDGKAYLGLITVGSCCNSSFKTRADNQVSTMKTWNSTPENHKEITVLQTTDDGKSNGDITIIGGTYKLKQYFYQYSYNNKPAHKPKETEFEIDPRIRTEPADATRVQTNYKKLNESDNKKKSLLKNIRDVGLYDFIRMAGIELIDIQTQVGQIPREMLEQFIKDYVSNEGHQYSSPKPDEKIVSIDVRVGGNAIIDFIYYDEKLLSFEVTEYGNGFSKEETDQYIEGAKNYGYDTIFNIANKISRKIN